MTDLTPRQSEIYDLVRRRCHDGQPPTIRELMAATGIQSPNGIKTHLDTLRRKGWIEVDPTKSRGIRLVADTVDVRHAGSRVLVSTSGPVAYTLAKWRAWLEEQGARLLDFERAARARG